MTTTLTRPTAEANPGKHRDTEGDRPVRRHLPRTVAFYLQASITLFFLAGSSAPTPLYAVYQSEWHFSPITTTVIFGIYALAVLSSLLTVGSLSDHIGRKPVLLVAIAVQAVTMVVFATADGVPVLIAARIIQGLSTGAAVGAVGAGLLDLNRTKGTIANAVAPLIGTGSGAIVSGLFIQYLPARTHLVYLVLLGVFIVQAIGVAFMAETSTPTPGARESLRVSFALPAAACRPLLIGAPVLVAIWSLAGLYGSLGPTLIGLVMGRQSFVLGGLSLFMLAIPGALAVLVLRSAPARPMMFVGTIAIIVGVGMTVFGVDDTNAPLFFTGGVIAGIGFGAGFQGVIRMVVPLAAEHERAGVLSILYSVSYVAMGVPAVLAGFLVVHGGGVLDTAREYGVVVIALAAFALVGLLRRSAEPAAVPVPA